MVATRSRILAPFLAVAAILAVATFADSCKGATISSGARDNSLSRTSDVQLSFHVMDFGTAAKSIASTSISPLLLPTATTLTVSLEPVDSGLRSPADQTVAISSSAPISVSFPDVEWGRYTVAAVASNGGGVAQFRQSASLTVSEDSASATLNLVPASSSETAVTGSDIITLQAATPYVYEMPTSMLSDGSGITAGCYQFTVSYSMVMGGTTVMYALDADGALMMSASLPYGMSINVTGGTRFTLESSSTADIGPCSTSAPSYIVFFNQTTGGSIDIVFNSYMM
jgi:hypothetical protein